MELSNAARTLTPNRKEDSELLRAQQHDSRSAESVSLQAPQHPVAGLQAAFGNRGVQRMLAPYILQPKLTVSARDEIHEKEADAVAEQVTAQASRAAAATGSDDDHNNPRGLDKKVTNPSSVQRSMLRRIPIHTLQQNLGNRALARLFQQTSPARAVPELSRKCACGGAAKEECAECQKNRVALQRSFVGATPSAQRSLDDVGNAISGAGQALVQKAVLARDVLGPGGGGAVGPAAAGGSGQPANGATTPSGTGADPTSPNGSTGSGLIVEDNAPNLTQGQMKKSDFLGRMKPPVSAAAQGALKGSTWESAGSVAIDPWFQQYAGQSAQELERTIQSSVPGAGKVADAGAYIPLVAAKVGSAVSDWVKTGNVPPGVPSGLPGVLGTIGSAVSSIAQGAKNVLSNIGGMLFKAKEGGARVTDDPRMIQAQLGGGEPLEGSLQGRMSSAFGYDFSGVRVHKDNQAAQLSADLNARAFTIGRNVAFGAGEYKPGNPIGDALIAHELAHVVQQGGASAQAPLQKAGAETGSLEQDADVSAVRAVVSLWSGAKAGLANIGKDAIPALKSGLKLQRCSKPPPPTPTEVHNLPGSVTPVSAPGEEILFTSVFSSTAPSAFETVYTGVGGHFDRPDSGPQEKKSPGTGSANLAFFIDSTWDGTTPVTVNMQIRSLSGGVIAARKDWKFSKKSYFPTSIRQFESEGEKSIAPGGKEDYLYVLGPELGPDGKPRSYQGQTILERFEPQACNISVGEMKPEFKAAHPELTTPEQLATFFFPDASINASFTVDKKAEQADAFEDTNGENNLNLAARPLFNALIAMKDVRFDKPQIFEAQPGVTLGRYIIRRSVKRNGAMTIAKFKA
jgi:Domain of unknown function (DUF4157)